jgi:hypothetical protein
MERRGKGEGGREQSAASLVRHRRLFGGDAQVMTRAQQGNCKIKISTAKDDKSAKEMQRKDWNRG